MKYLVLICLFALCACWEVPQADLSGVNVEKKDKKLQKVSKGEVLQHALVLGRERAEQENTRLIKNLNDSLLLPIEKELFEAYQEAHLEGHLADENVQFYEQDKKIIFTKPNYLENKFIGVISVQMNTAEVIKSLQKR